MPRAPISRPFRAMTRNTFVIWGLPMALVLSLVPNIAAGFGAMPALTTGVAALVAVWLLTWLRLGTVGVRHEFSVLAVIPFVPEVLRAGGGIPWPEGGLPHLVAWLLILFWCLAAIIALLCLKNDRSEEASPYDGTFVLLGTLTVAMVVIESFHLLYPAP